MRIILLTVLMSVFSFADGHSQRLELPRELQSSIIPNFFVLASNNEDELYRDDLKKNAEKAKAKRVVLSFFATYCVSCKEEFAVLKKNSDRLKREGVQVYLINVGEDIHSQGEKVAEMVKKYAGNAFPFYFDPYVNSLKKFGLVKQNEEAKLPLTLILDSDLRVLSILIGEMGSDFPQILWSEF